MKASKLFIAGALAIASLSLASCSQDEPTTPTEQVSSTTRQEALSKSELIRGKTFFYGYKRNVFMNILKQQVSTYVDRYIYATNVVVSANNIDSEVSHYILNKERLLIITGATKASIYNWMHNENNDLAIHFTKMCPDDFKDDKSMVGYTLISSQGFEAYSLRDITPFATEVNKFYKLDQ